MLIRLGLACLFCRYYGNIKPGHVPIVVARVRWGTGAIMHCAGRTGCRYGYQGYVNFDCLHFVYSIKRKSMFAQHPSHIPTSNPINVVKNLVHYETKFFLPNNLSHLVAYCKERRVLSRSEISVKRPERYIKSYSHSSDTRRGTLSRIFGAIDDLGRMFSVAKEETPANPCIEGPIMLVFSSNIYHSMRDVVLTRSSRYDQQGEWRDNAITDPAILDQILEPNDFGNPRGYTAEVSCAECELPLPGQLEQIIVEPITFNGHRLVEVVRNLFGIWEHIDDQGTVPIIERAYRGPKRALLAELVAACDRKLPQDPAYPLWSIAEEDLPSMVREWPQPFRDNLVRWCWSFSLGTLRLLRKLQPVESHP